jgi:chromosome segregation ATPase
MQLCSKYKTEPAIASYVWAWGETGFCSSRYQLELTQIATSLSRTVSFAPIGNAAEIPMERSERTKLKAECLVLEEELTEAKGRAVDLYRENVRLSQQVQAYTVRMHELEAQLRDATLVKDRAETRLLNSDAAQGEMVEELTRLRTIAKYVEEQTDPNVVGQ